MYSFIISSKKHGDFEIIIDESDMELVLSRNWSISKGNSNYFRVETRINNKLVRLHRFILGITDKKIEVDHINRNPLDNRRENLRLANRNQNMRNIKFKDRPNKTGFIGVYKSHGKFRGCLSVDDKTIHVKGAFETAKEAAVERDKLAFKTSGEFAILNFPKLLKDR